MKKTKDYLLALAGICFILAFWISCGADSLLVGGILATIGIAISVLANRIPDQTR